MATPNGTTQEAHPWRTTARTAFQVLIGLAVIIPLVADELELSAPWALAVVGVAAGFTRVMAIPAVEAFLEHHLPWLAAQ